MLVGKTDPHDAHRSPFGEVKVTTNRPFRPSVEPRLGRSRVHLYEPWVSKKYMFDTRFSYMKSPAHMEKCRGVCCGAKALPTGRTPKRQGMVWLNFTTPI